MTVFFSIRMNTNDYSKKNKNKNMENINAFRLLLRAFALSDIGANTDTNEQMNQYIEERIDERVEQLINGNIIALDQLYQTRFNKWIERIGGSDKVGYYNRAEKTKQAYEKINTQLDKLKTKIQSGDTPVWEFQRLALGVFIECTEQNGKDTMVKSLLTSTRQQFEEVTGSLIPLFQSDINQMLLNLSEKCRLNELQQFIDKVSKNVASRTESNGVELKNVLSWKP